MNLDLKRLLYEFDLNGFVVADGILDPELVDALLVAWESTAPGVAAFDLSFGWGGAWVDLLQTGVQRLDPLLSILLGKNYRLDHAFAVTEAGYGNIASPDAGRARLKINKPVLYPLGPHVEFDI